MDGFSYTDIFATKGMEYLVIIAFLAMLIPFSIILNRQIKMTRDLKKSIGILTANVLRFPQGLFYGRNHTWLFMEKSGTAKVGLDDLLLHITGHVKFSKLKNPGDIINKGEVMTELEQEGKLLQIFSPVSGTIVASNPQLMNDPDMLHTDPYGKGWLYRIKPANWITDVKSCYFADEATTWSENELVRFKDFLAVTMKNHTPNPSMVILQDGGELSDHTLASLSEPVWGDFQKEFLNLYKVKD